jgi:endogenous inhibitor of DNA gyrase (YacG/DUF329 family)
MRQLNDFEAGKVWPNVEWVEEVVDAPHPCHKCGQINPWWNSFGEVFCGRCQNLTEARKWALKAKAIRNENARTNNGT